MAVLVGACSKETGAPAATTTRPSTSTAAVTTTTAEHEAIQALRRYFDAYAHAVQTKDPDSILPYLDQENPEILKATKQSIQSDIDSGDPGTRTVSAIYVEFERPSPRGSPTVSLRAIYSTDQGASARSFGLIKIDGKWLLTATAGAGFER